MKKQLLCLLMFVIGLVSYGQINFEKGYYVNNANQKIYCLIKNIDWNNNPTAFEYKVSDTAEIEEVEMRSIKEFGIIGRSKYVRKEVDMDRSTNNLYRLSHDREPKFKKETLFLKVLVQGKASLYVYKERDLRRYFYNTEEKPIEQLVYKRYQKSNNEIGTNSRFKNQLWNNVQYASMTQNSVKKLRYIHGDLINYFVGYNESRGDAPINYAKKAKKDKDLFNLTIRAGVRNATLDISNVVSNLRDTNFDNQQTFSVGAEVEFVMPFNKNKWSVIMEPTYQYFSVEKTIAVDQVEVEYTSIELPIGIRHYFFLNDHSKLFLNASFVTDFDMNSKVVFENSEDLEIRTTNNLALGVGYKFKNRYSIEARYQTKREVLSQFASWNSNYRSFSILLGYSIF